MTDPFVLFTGDICWGKCRSRKAKIRLLDSGRVVYLCDNCFGHVSPSHLDLLAVKVE